MAIKKEAVEQRIHVRHKLRKDFFANIRGNLSADLATVTDLSKDGLGLELQGKKQKLQGKGVLIDLVFDKERTILRSLLSRVVFSHDTERSQKGKCRYGVKFVNLSSLEKHLLGVVRKKYIASE